MKRRWAVGEGGSAADTQGKENPRHHSGDLP